VCIETKGVKKNPNVFGFFVLFLEEVFPDLTREGGNGKFLFYNENHAWKVKAKA